MRVLVRVSAPERESRWRVGGLKKPQLSRGPLSPLHPHTLPLLPPRLTAVEDTLENTELAHQRLMRTFNQLTSGRSLTYKLSAILFFFFVFWVSEPGKAAHAPVVIPPPPLPNNSQVVFLV